MSASPNSTQTFIGHILQRIAHYRSNGNKREETHRGGKVLDLRICIEI